MFWLFWLISLRVIHVALFIIEKVYIWCPSIVRQYWDTLYLRSPLLQGLFSYRFGLSPSLKRSDEVDEVMNTHDDLLSSPDDDYQLLGWALGLHVTRHEVITPDGYILSLFHLFLAEKEQKKHHTIPKKHQYPLLILHGILQDADFFLSETNPNYSLIVRLIHDGHDIWLGNNRGCKYAQEHCDFSPSSNEYWDFTIDELIAYDVPVFIDFIKLSTQANKVNCIGFSQGSTQLLGALAHHVELNQSIACVIALAPAFYLKTNVCYKALLYLIMKFNLFHLLVGTLHFPIILTRARTMLNHKVYTYLIGRVLNALLQWNFDNISTERMMKLTKHIYSTSSAKIISHWMFNIYHGSLHRYACGTPYDVGKITCPVALIASEKDNGLLDSHSLAKKLSNCIMCEQISNYEHLDVIWADNAHSVVFDHIATALTIIDNMQE